MPSRPSCADGCCSAAPTRTGRSSPRPSGGSAAPSTVAGRRDCPGHRGPSTPAGTWPGCTAPGATGTRCWSSPTSPARSRRRWPGRCSTPCARPWSWPAARTSPDCSRDLRRYWHKEGLLAIHASPMEMEIAGRRGDAAGVLSSYDDAVETITRIWHPVVHRPDPARRRGDRRAGPGDAAAVGGRAADVRRARRAAARRRAHRPRARTPTRRSPGGRRGGPGSSGWTPRRLRVRWLAGVEPPPVDVLVSAWQEADSLTEEFGDVYELARAAHRPGRHPPRGRRHRRRAGGRRPGPGDGPRAWAPTRCSTTSARSAAPRPGRPPAPTRSLRASPRSWGWWPRGGPTARSDGAVHQHQDRERPRVQHPRQARCVRSHRGRRDRAPEGPARLTRAASVSPASRGNRHFSAVATAGKCRNPPRSSRGCGGLHVG